MSQWLFNLYKYSAITFLLYLGIINQTEINDLITYMKKTLSGKAHDIKTTTRLESHPCVITVQEMASARHFARIQTRQMGDEMLYTLLRPCLEINPKHSLIKKLCQLMKTDTKLADLLIKQVLRQDLLFLIFSDFMS